MGKNMVFHKKKGLYKILGCLELQRGQVFLIKKEVEKAQKGHAWEITKQVIQQNRGLYNRNSQIQNNRKKDPVDSVQVFNRDRYSLKIRIGVSKVVIWI